MFRGAGLPGAALAAGAGLGWAGLGWAGLGWAGLGWLGKHTACNERIHCHSKEGGRIRMPFLQKPGPAFFWM